MSTADPEMVSVMVRRHQTGDPTARAELIKVALHRLERLARKMLRQYPSVARWEDTGDILQNSLIRLDRALREVAPATSKDFFGLAAEQMRRTLLDMARHYRGAHGMGKNQESGVRVGDADGGLDPSDGTPSQDDLDRWAAFHTAVAELPVAEREVFMLTFYHNWTQPQIAELFGIDDRTVRRRWQSAAVLLHTALGGDLPVG